MPKKTNTKVDPVPSENREIMDYLTENSEAIPSEIYVKLSDMLKKKYENAPPKKKYFKIKYSITKVNTLAALDYSEEHDEQFVNMNTFSFTKINEAILVGKREGTGNSHFNDILQGCVQLNSANNLCSNFRENATFTNVTICVSSPEDKAYVTEVLTILELNEYEP